MIDTNALLSIAFGIVANFAQLAHVPPDCVPQQRSDLEKLLVGTPRSPLDLYMVGPRGNEFWIEDGSVFQYESPDSYFHGNSGNSRKRLSGRGTLETNQLLTMASNIVQSFAKSANPAAGLPPHLESSLYETIPFYQINWPSSNSVFYDGVAAIEIDARDGRAAFVALRDSAYRDLAFAREISNKVCRPDPPGTQVIPPPPRKAVTLPKPSSSYVQILIQRWLEFCVRLELDPGKQTNVADVDWDNTFMNHYSGELGRGTLCHISFTNGNRFECLDGAVFGQFYKDACFVGAWVIKPMDEWKHFEAVAITTWEQLAQQLNDLLTRRIGVPKEYLEKFSPRVYATGPKGVTRCVIRWYESGSIGKESMDEIKRAMVVEFDLGTGRIKGIRIDDPELLKWFQRPANDNQVRGVEK